MPFFSNQSKVDSLIRETIRNYIKATLGIKAGSQLRRVEWFPVYSLCEYTEEKIVSKICARVKNRTSYMLIDVRNIEAAGITILEFVDFLIAHGAKKIESPASLLEII